MLCNTHISPIAQAPNNYSWFRATFTNMTLLPTYEMILSRTGQGDSSVQISELTLAVISFLTEIAPSSSDHESCLCFLLQNVYYTSNQQLHVGVLSPTIDDDDNRCLVDVNSRPRLIECNYAKAKRMKLYWQFTQVILPQNTLQKVQRGSALFQYLRHA